MEEYAGRCEKCCASNHGGLGTAVAAMLVANTDPFPGAEGVPPDASISVLFTMIPDLDTCTPETITFSPPCGWTVREGEAPEEIVITPAEPLEPGTTYTVKLDGVLSADGMPLFPFQFSFTTAE